MITISNGLSLVRAPLAFLFCQGSPTLRIAAVVLAMLTDSVDGYFARRNKSVTKFGAVLDPAMDKFFVYFALTALFFEGKIALFELSAMLSRDFFLCLYAFIMTAMGRWHTIVFRAIRWGKITTAMQFLGLIGLILDISFPWYVFASFIVMGWLAFLELFQTPPRASEI
jgi:CDP-diacylglycerol--glycerol-3-phosphate 3-phosphatidyltransferase